MTCASSVVFGANVAALLGLALSATRTCPGIGSSRSLEYCAATTTVRGAACCGTISACLAATRLNLVELREILERCMPSSSSDVDNMVAGSVSDSAKDSTFMPHQVFHNLDYLLRINALCGCANCCLLEGVSEIGPPVR